MVLLKASARLATRNAIFNMDPLDLEHNFLLPNGRKSISGDKLEAVPGILMLNVFDFSS